MADYNNNARSFIYGLSDFWLLYFKEIDQLQSFYKGTEILVGQSYLDLLSLLLNNSLQDTVLFNKEYFKLLQIKETDVKFKAGTTTAADRYEYILPDDVASLQYLNNKIIEPTVALDRDVNFEINDTLRALEFHIDPTNAYYERKFGSGNSEFTLRSKIMPGDNLRIHLNDTGAAVGVTRSSYAVTVTYDGPANTGTTRALDIAQAINTHPEIKGLLLVELSGLGTGTASPAGTVGLEPLLKVSVNPIDGFATRQLEMGFGGKLSINTVTDWIAEGVEKGDVLRLIGGPTVGAPQEYTIDLVRKTALYFAAGNSLDLLPSDRTSVAILREPADAVSAQEPITNSGFISQSGADGTVTAASREFTSPTANFSPVHKGDLIELLGVSNIGYLEILAVLDANTVTVASTSLVDETPITWNLLSVVGSADIGMDGTITNNGDGTATFTAVSALFTSAAASTVLKVDRGSILELYDIIEFVSATEVILDTPVAATNGAGLTWGWAKHKMPTHQIIFSPPAGWPVEDTVIVSAKRLIDNAAVQAGRDYVVLVDTGRIQALTVWKTATTNTVTYNYRIAVYEHATAIQTGADGSIVSASPNTFTAPTAAFNANHVGYAIAVQGSGLTGATNNGVHTIAAVISATTVELTADKIVPVLADPNNGVLSWELKIRAVLETEDVVETISETACWAPNAAIDKFHLYNTFGYLINKFDRSSETYRALIKGIFQLFMLGPTLERFESAINTVGGLSVIRDNGEVLINYDNGAEQMGSDGSFDFSTKLFTSATAAFTASDAAKFIYAVDGLNANRLYKISRVVSATEVELEVAPTTSGPDEWELTSGADHTVETSRAVYTFSRDVPLKSKVTDTANFGTYIFRAFEVLTDVFEVTDYVETPLWWESIRVPETLLPEEGQERRQSSPALFENVVGPADEGQIGDPGFFVGADSDGFNPSTVLIRDHAGAADGILTGDPYFPDSNNVFLATPTGAFSNTDLGNTLISADQTFRIVEIVSATEVRLESFLPVVSATGVKWFIYSNVLPKRNKAVYVILNTWLKHHLLFVRFDISLLGRISASLLEDLQELVFVAKPTYTYIVVSPSALFEEVLHIGEDLELAMTTHLGGLEGEIIAGNAAPLTVVGSSWRVGNWFRYVTNTSTFGTPAASITDSLGVPTAGYTYYTNKIYVDPAVFTSDGAPIDVAGEITATATTSGSALSLSNDSGEVTATFPAGSLNDGYLMATLRVSGSVSGNDGDYRLGAVTSATSALFRGVGVVNETGLDWEIVTKGSGMGRVYNTSTGECYFDDGAGIHEFTPFHVGDYIRRVFTSYVSNQSFQIYEVISSSRVRLAEMFRVDPIVGDPDIAASVAANVLTVAYGDVVFSKSMARADRAASDLSTSLTDQYFVVFASGLNSGKRVRIEEYVTANSVLLSGALVDDAATTIYIEHEKAYTVTDEVADWEHIREQIAISGSTVDLTDTPVQDTDPAVPYTAYGVMEPDDPATGVFDDTQGDTLYHIGMPDPRQKRGKSRTGKDMDMREEPIQITRT